MSSTRPKQLIVSWNGYGAPLTGPARPRRRGSRHRRELAPAVDDLGRGRRRRCRCASRGAPRAELVHLRAGAVELPLHRGRPTTTDARERVLDVVGGLRAAGASAWNSESLKRARPARPPPSRRAQWRRCTAARHGGATHLRDLDTRKRRPSIIRPSSAPGAASPTRSRAELRLVGRRDAEKARRASPCDGPSDPRQRWWRCARRQCRRSNNVTVGVWLRAAGHRIADGGVADACLPWRTAPDRYATAIRLPRRASSAGTARGAYWRDRRCCSRRAGCHGAASGVVRSAQRPFRAQGRPGSVGAASNAFMRMWRLTRAKGRSSAASRAATMHSMRRS